jgi:transposase
MDNSSPHRAGLTARNLEENHIITHFHPAFSPELAPSDFFLFDALKGQLSGRTMTLFD